MREKSISADTTLPQVWFSLPGRLGVAQESWGGLIRGLKESDKVGNVLKKPLWEPGEEGRRGWDLGSQVFDS